MAAYIRSVMNNSVSDAVIIEFSRRNESYRNWLDLALLFLRQLTSASVGEEIKLLLGIDPTFYH